LAGVRIERPEDAWSSTPSSASNGAGGADLENGGAGFPRPEGDGLPDIAPPVDLSRASGRYRLRDSIAAMLRPPFDLLSDEPAKRGPAVCGCGRPGFNAEAVTIHRRDERVSVGGVYRCDSAWLCPVCAPRKTLQRQEAVQGVVESLLCRGGRAAMVTLTVRHNGNDGLARLREIVQSASRAARQGRAWKQIVDRARIVGVLSGPEVTLSKAGRGWHFHIHLLLLFDCDRSDVVRETAEQLVDRYREAIRRRGGSSSRSAQDIEVISVDDCDGAARAAEYVAKSAAWEVTGGTKKEGAGWQIWEVAALAAGGDK
jgi:hypothetical protein